MNSKLSKKSENSSTSTTPKISLIPLQENNNSKNTPLLTSVKVDN